jgi:hypothetical protein
LPPFWRSEGGYIAPKPQGGIDLAPALDTFLSHRHVLVDAVKWSDGRKGESQGYALEIEGLALRGDKLYVGLKWPLVSDHALLLTYDVRIAAFVALDSVFLDGMGVSGLAIATYKDESRLIVVANPTQKPDDDDCGNPLYNRSVIFTFRLPQTGPFGESLSSLPAGDKCGKLEGISLRGDAAYLVYDRKLRPDSGLVRKSVVWIDSLFVSDKH